MRKNIVNIIVAFFLITTLSLSACSDNKTSDSDSIGEGAGQTEVTAEIWGAYSTDKIMQNDVSGYDDMKKPAEINLRVIGGEEEAYQLIITAHSGDINYDVELNDLVDDNGNVYSKENIKVYNERYVELGAPSEYYTKPGFYPDCLVPFENAKKLGENKVKENNNQGLYVSFNIPENQKAGTYKGSIKLTAGEKLTAVPVSLNVAGASIGKETHTKSVFLNQWNFERGEKDSTPEMFDAYNKALFQRRIGCDIVTIYTEDVNYYAEKVCEYAKDPTCPTYSIPWFKKNYQNSGYVLNGRTLNAGWSYDADKLYNYFMTIAYKGLAENVDPFKKAVVYGFDEPDLNFGPAKASVYVKEWSYIVKQTKVNVIKALKADGTIEDKNLLENMLESINKVPHLILSSSFLNFDYVPDEEDIVYCPEFQFIQNQGAQDQYRLKEGNDLWWYGCVAPTYPYPTYHIADTVISARLESWMKANYNIQGNLYWATNAWSQSSGSGEVTVFPEDYYGSKVVGTGEGILFYPGARYGVYGPLPSIRIEQIRDGLEEYEMIYKLSQIYKAKAIELHEDFDEQAIMSYLYNAMYSGTMVGTNSLNFESNRQKLITLLEMAESDAEAIIKSVTMGAGSYTFEVYTSKSAEVKQAGKIVENKKEAKNGYIHTVEIKLGKDKELDLCVQNGKDSYGFKLMLGRDSRTYDAVYMSSENRITSRKGGSGVETVLVDASSVNKDAVKGEKYVQLKLANSSKVTQDFLIVDDEAIGKIGKEDSKLAIRLYNGDSKRVLIRVYFEYINNPGKFSSYATIFLYPGLDNITINNLSDMDWKKIGGIKSIRIMVGEKGDHARDNLYFADMTIYK